MGEFFSTIDILIIIGISQGILLSITLWLITDKNKKANIILCFLLLIATLMLTGRFLFFRFLDSWIFQWSLWVDTVIFLFGPLLYMYVRRLLLAENFNYMLPIHHFFPALGMVLISLFSIIFYTPDEYFELHKNGDLVYLFRGLIILGIASNSYYLFCSFHLVKKYKKQAKEDLSFQQNHVSYLHYFLLSISVFIAAWIFNFVNSTFFNINFSLINYDSVWVAISVFLYMVGYFSLKQPELFRLQIESNPKNKKERLSKSETENLKKEMDALMKDEKLFLKPDLTMKDLAEKLDTSTNNISWMLNTIYKINFYDFINEYRIEEFVCKVKKKEYLERTILGLSKDVGFKSKSTFYKAFRLKMDETPSSFIGKLH